MFCNYLNINELHTGYMDSQYILIRYLALGPVYRQVDIDHF